MILCPGNGKEAYEAIKEAVESGKISEKRLNESVLRILKVKIKREIIPEDTDLIPAEE
jgi:beta-N-acetylhexosaminidase